MDEFHSLLIIKMFCEFWFALVNLNLFDLNGVLEAYSFIYLNHSYWFSPVYLAFFFINLLGVSLCQLEMQEVFPQPVEAFEAYLDSHVQEAT